MIVYRVEHPIDDIGPYMTRGPLGSRSNEFRRFQSALAYWHTNGIIRPIPIDIWSPGELCGMSSIERLKEWFEGDFPDSLVEEFELELQNIWANLQKFGFFVRGREYIGNTWRLSRADKEQILVLKNRHNKIVFNEHTRGL